MSQSFLLPGKCTSNLLNRYETRKTFSRKKVSCSTSSVQQLRTLLISGILKLDSSWKVKVFKTRTRQRTPPESIPSKSSDIYPPTYCYALEQVNPLMGGKVTRAKRQFDEYFSFDNEISRLIPNAQKMFSKNFHEENWENAISVETPYP